MGRVDPEALPRLQSALAEALPLCLDVLQRDPASGIASKSARLWTGISTVPSPPGALPGFLRVQLKHFALGRGVFRGRG